MVERSRESWRKWWAQKTAPPMFCLSLAFLILVAVMLVLWVDVPLFLGTEEGSAGPDAVLGPDGERIETWIAPTTAVSSGYLCIYALWCLWPLFALELAVQYAIRDRSVPFWRQRYYLLLVCAVPPLRMCGETTTWTARFGFRPWAGSRSTISSRDRLETMFSVPMIIIALTILPVLLIEFGMRHHVLTRPWLQCMLHTSTGVIWFAFAAEFVVMVSVAEKKLRYCREHWIDLAIILLPFISFLRSLRAVRATRLRASRKSSSCRAWAGSIDSAAWPCAPFGR